MEFKVAFFTYKNTLIVHFLYGFTHLASGRGDREDWFEEGGCPETRQVEGRSSSIAKGMG